MGNDKKNLVPSLATVSPYCSDSGVYTSEDRENQLFS